MSTTTQPQANVSDVTDRRTALHETFDGWISELVELIQNAKGTDEFQEWLDIKSRFHDYSMRNTLLIKQQCPTATKVAGYQTWREEFNRHVSEGESAIYIWAPIITQRCPKCHNSSSYHNNIGCDYNDTAPETWSRGLVGFRPAPVFDVSQTEGEPLPELNTDAMGNADGLVQALETAADEFDVTVSIIPADQWEHGPSNGVCKNGLFGMGDTEIEIKQRNNKNAAMASTLIHEYAHAILHSGITSPGERPKREVEAEAVAYISGRYFGLDTSNSAFYLAAWNGDDTDVLQERLQRINDTAKDIIQATESNLNT